MGQVVGTVSKRDHLSYYWNLGNKSLANIWRSPEIVDFPFCSTWQLCLNQTDGMLSVCHKACVASFSFDVTIVLWYSTRMDKFNLNSVKKCEQYRDADIDEYILKTIETKDLKSIYCAFSNVRGVCGIDQGKGEQEGNVIWRATEATGKRRYASSQCAIGGLAVLKGEKKIKVKHHVIETKGENKEASIECPVKELSAIRGEQETKVKLNVVETEKEKKDVGIQCKIKEPATTRGLVTLSANLRELFLGEEESDVTIQVGDQKYPVHRNILRSRSPVFESMLKHNMIENTQGVVDIPDCDPYIFRDFLVFLYAGKLDDISEENVFELYRMSDKYNVKELKMDCVDFMLDNLTIDVICDVLSVAMKHNEEQLLSHATEFFVENVRDILPTVDWKKFVQENPIEANELFIKSFR